MLFGSKFYYCIPSLCVWFSSVKVREFQTLFIFMKQSWNLSRRDFNSFKHGVNTLRSTHSRARVWASQESSRISGFKERKDHRFLGTLPYPCPPVPPPCQYPVAPSPNPVPALTGPFFTFLFLPCPTCSLYFPAFSLCPPCGNLVFSSSGFQPHLPALSMWEFPTVPCHGQLLPNIIVVRVINLMGREVIVPFETWFNSRNCE